jgi:hypothetical protein
VARLNRDAVGGAKWTWREADKLCSFDAVLVRNGIDYGIVEVKSRNGEPTRYGEWHIAKHKIDSCQMMAKQAGLFFFLVFAWDGNPFICNLSLVSEKFQAHVSGRYDRNDAADVEEMYLIPSKLFKAI